MKRASWLLGMTLILAIATLLMARPGVVKTKDGRRFEGEVTDRGDDGAVINTKLGALTIGRQDIASIEYTDNIPQQYKQKLDALPKNAGARAHVEIGQWLLENKSYELAMTEASAALRMEPDNAEAKLLKQIIEKQLVWDRGNPASPDTGGKIDTPATPTREPAAPNAGARLAVRPEQKKLLDKSQINTIRQWEIREGERVAVSLDRDVKNRFIEHAQVNSRDFNALPDIAKAMEIVRRGTPEMAPDVKILADPQALAGFRRQVQPVLQTGCATAACHGGANPGTFYLPTGGNADAVTYTNFYIVTRYSAEIDGTLRKGVDRMYPKNSLILQFGLPRDKAKIPHPQVQGFVPVFRSEADPRLAQVANWLQRTLSPVEPTYQLDYPVHQAVASNPTNPTAPTTQPTEPRPNGPDQPPPPPRGDEKRSGDVNDVLKEARDRLRPRGL